MSDLSGVPVQRPAVTGAAETVYLPPPGPPCSKCGQPMPPLSDELRAMAAAAGGVVLSHEVCPGDAPAEPTGRYFEVRCEVVEIIEEADQRGEQIPRALELLSFKAGHRDVDLDAAMRPLALALGEKWTEAEKRAKIADA